MYHIDQFSLPRYAKIELQLQTGGIMKVAFQDYSFAFEFVRNPGFAYYGGSDSSRPRARAHPDWQRQQER